MSDDDPEAMLAEALTETRRQRGRDGSTGRARRLARLLDDLAEFIARFVAFPAPEHCDAVTLWAAHTHVLDAFESTPRLAVVSPEKQSGKTRTLEVLEVLVPNPMHVVNTTSAALFRQVTLDRPTLLMDEADTYLGPAAARQHEELRGFVNAGHRRGAKAYRCVGEPSKMRVESFPAFCALAIAAIGDLPDTVIDRAVVVRMRRRGPGEHVEPFRFRTTTPEGHALRGRIAAWAKHARKPLEAAEPPMPEGINDRPADVWEALLAISDLAGDEWSERARAACVKLNGERAEADVSSGVRLLGDIRDVFTGDAMASADLVGRLCKVEGAPWGVLKRGPLDASGLARRLRPYDIRSEQVRIDGKQLRGYPRTAFIDAWERYLPAFSVDPSHASHASQGS